MYLVGDLWELQPLQGQSILGYVSIQLSVPLTLVLGLGPAGTISCI